MEMRKSKQILFWRNHKVYRLKVNGKLIGWYGQRIPKTAQEIIDEVEE